MHYILCNLVKNYRFGMISNGGRNNLGRVCVNGRGEAKNGSIGLLIISEELGLMGD